MKAKQSEPNTPKLPEDVEKDLIKAVQYLELASKQGNASAKSCLGHLYQNGNGVELNFEEFLNPDYVMRPSGDPAKL